MRMTSCFDDFETVGFQAATAQADPYGQDDGQLSARFRYPSRVASTFEAPSDHAYVHGLGGDMKVAKFDLERAAAEGLSSIVAMAGEG